ncbi:MAG: hypothetical protein U1C33_07080, partial [Candidatus Cloacimonadaceae bacterium]|nr:hypothetical protein [Candidatus Cloacimonadaceae bacterium]
DSGIIKIITTDIYNNVREVLHTVHIDNALPTATLIATDLAGNTLTIWERNTDVILNAQATDAHSGVATILYEYQMQGAAAWTALPIVNDAPWTITLPIDANVFEFGANYRFQATVTDNVGHVYTTESGYYEVTDHNTDIVIVNINGNVPVNNQIATALRGDLNVVTQVNSPLIERIQFIISPMGENDWTDVLVTANLVQNTLNFDDFESGMYDLGVRPREARNTLVDPVHVVSFMLDNTIPTADMILVNAAGDAITGVIHRNTSLTLNAQAADAHSGVASVLYEYQMQGAAAWTALPLVVAAPFVADLSIDNSFEYGAYYIFKATVTDKVGLTTTSITEPFEAI